jgi:pantoate--beta-alanine ligase
LEIIERIEDLRRIVRRIRREDKIIGLVPTMGALHEGHVSLIRLAASSNDFTVVSIFVNPTQFGPAEDFERYPRSLDPDLEKSRSTGVDLVFAPTADEMYPSGFGTYTEVEGLTQMLEGASRPGHFRGVATIVLKLFNLVEPHRAYFGLKDYQQLKVIQKMVRDLSLDIEIVPGPTVREPDGLAMSSRNAYLEPRERQAAAALFRALQEAKARAEAGESDAESIRKAAEDVLRAEPLADIDYVAVVDPETLQPVGQVRGPALVALAVRIGSVRLIDSAVISNEQ